MDDPVQVAERNIVKFNEKKDEKDDKEFKSWSPPLNKHEFGGWVQNPVPKSQAMEELEAIGKKYNRNILLHS